MVRSCILIIYVYAVWLGGTGGFGDGLAMVSRVIVSIGFVYETLRGEITIGSSDVNNSGGVVVGALVCGTECSWFKSRFMLFHLLKCF